MGDNLEEILFWFHFHVFLVFYYLIKMKNKNFYL